MKGRRQHNRRNWQQRQILDRQWSEVSGHCDSEEAAMIGVRYHIPMDIEFHTNSPCLARCQFCQRLIERKWIMHGSLNVGTDLWRLIPYRIGLPL
jgi:hypothetical protein